ncbi:MAG TPA: sodium:glutamate symporter, partial [Spirochaetia bacterium]|nr:sodium:glutamate symporter [Spirochaetia bacterium]
IRTRIRFFQRFLIPNALTAGFILLPLYNFVFPALGLDSMTLEALTYHLLSVSFVAMSLRKAPKRPNDGRIFATSVAVLSQYAIQTTVGLLLTFLLISTIMPELFHSFGWLMPLGFVLGPGQAFSIGEGWRVAGIEGAGSIGLTFAAIGFIVSSFGGVFLINYGLRKGWMSKEHADAINKQGIKRGVFPRGSRLPVGSLLTTETEAIDSMTLNGGLVLISYLVAYIFLEGMQWALGFVGPTGERLATNLWGISFIFAAIAGLGIKGLLTAFRADHILDNQTLNRVSGFAVDYMVTAAIAAISLVIVGQYWLPILLLSAAGTGLCFLLVPWFTSRIFKDHQFHRMLLIFGVSTGTLSTGLALLRVVDPEFETPVASDYAYASGITFVLAIPFILSINLPVRAYETGDMLYFWLALGIAALYLAFTFVAYLFLAKKRAFASASQVWHKD